MRGDKAMKQMILKTELLPDQLALFYLGQEGFLVKAGGKYLLFDPYLTDYVDRNCCTEDVIWRRRYPAPVKPEMLDFVDVVFCSHAHFDHTDPDTIRAICAENRKARFIVPAPVYKQFCGYGVPADRVLAARPDTEIRLDGLTVLPVPAAHEELHLDAQGNSPELGYRVQLGDTVLYHAGDSCVYDGLAARLKGTDIAMLPVNGRDFYKLRRDIVGNMNVTEAVELCREIEADLFIPMHFDLYDVNSVPAGSIAQEVERQGSPVSYHIFRPGERFLFAKKRTAAGQDLD